MMEERQHQNPRNHVEGTVSALLFRNEENGYTVLRLDCGPAGEITAVGKLSGVRIPARSGLLKGGNPYKIKGFPPFSM